MDFADRLKELRKDKGLTQSELAFKAGISASSIINYENKRRLNPPYIVIKKIAAALDVPLDSLIEVEYTEDGPRIPSTEEEERKAREDSGAFFADMRKITLNSRFDKLNDAGQQKAVDYVSDLADHPRYSNS